MVDGKIGIPSMMYIALSYKQRIDCKEPVGFVMKIKELIEQPFQKGLTNEKEFLFLYYEKAR